MDHSRPPLPQPISLCHFGKGPEWKHTCGQHHDWPNSFLGQPHLSLAQGPPAASLCNSCLFFRASATLVSISDSRFASWCQSLHAMFDAAVAVSLSGLTGVADDDVLEEVSVRHGAGRRRGSSSSSSSSSQKKAMSAVDSLIIIVIIIIIPSF